MDGTPQGTQPAGSPEPQPASPVATAPPPGYYPPQAAAAAPAPKKKGKGCLIAVLVAVLLLCMCCCGTVFGLGRLVKPKDLGITYSEADYWSALSKAGVEVEGLEPGGDVAVADVVYEGSKPLDATFTPAEVSALVSYSHWPGWPVHDTQVRFNGGSNVEVAGIASYQGGEYVFYLDADAAVRGRTVGGSANSAEVFGVPAPADLVAQGEPAALRIINDRLARVEGLDITTAEVLDGQLHIVGTVPAKVSVVAP